MNTYTTSFVSIKNAGFIPSSIEEEASTHDIAYPLVPCVKDDNCHLNLMTILTNHVSGSSIRWKYLIEQNKDVIQDELTRYKA